MTTAANECLTDDDREWNHVNRLAYFTAQAALSGHTLQKVRTGYMLVSGNTSKHCMGLDTVQAILQRLESIQSPEHAHRKATIFRGEA